MRPLEAGDGVFDRSFEALDAVFAYADEFFETNDVDSQTSFALKLAIEEIFTNFVKYNPDGRDGISVALRMEAGAVVVDLIDPDSAEFDVTEFDKVDTTSALEQRVAGGLGIYLVKKMVDDVQYHHTGRKSTIVLTKKMVR